MVRGSVSSKPICTCIIPFYNEGLRILDVLSVVKSIPLPLEIICVDDGSTDNGSSLIKKYYKTVSLLRNTRNKGKSAAISKGLSFARSDYILLLDADLQNLSAIELTSAIELITKKPEIDMMILRRRFDPFISKVVRGDVLVSGERILKKKDLQDILKKHVKAYEIEPAINNYMLNRDACVRWYLHSGTNVPKTKKIGFFPGIRQELKYYKSVLAFNGLKTYLHTIIVFCHNDIQTPDETNSFKHGLYTLKQVFRETFGEEILQLNESILDNKRLQNIISRTKKHGTFLRELMQDL